MNPPRPPFRCFEQADSVAPPREASAVGSWATTRWTSPGHPRASLMRRSSDHSDLDEHAGDAIRSHSGSHRLSALEFCSAGWPT